MKYWSEPSEKIRQKKSQILRTEALILRYLLTNSGLQVGARTYPQTSQLQAAPGLLKKLVLSQAVHPTQSPGIRGLTQNPEKAQVPIRKTFSHLQDLSPYHCHSSNHFCKTSFRKSEKNYLNLKKRKKKPPQELYSRS